MDTVRLVSILGDQKLSVRWTWVKDTSWMGACGCWYAACRQEDTLSSVAMPRLRQMLCFIWVRFICWIEFMSFFKGCACKVKKICEIKRQLFQNKSYE